MILEGIKKVVEKSKYVKINLDRLDSLASKLKKNSIKHWTDFSPIDVSDLDEEEKVAFLTIFNSISFNYWGDKKWVVNYKGRTSDRGTFSMLLAIRRAIDEGKPILNPLYLSQISGKDLNEIFNGNCEIPLFEERLVILREIGSVIVRKYGGRFSSLLLEDDALLLLNKIVNDFPSFRDEALYLEDKICFMKRAQLLISDLNHIFNLNLKNIDKLTACADYILPMVLAYYGILGFNELLNNKIKKNKQIVKGSEMEIEIRANTIMAVEYLKEKLKDKGIKLNSMQINDFLWLKGAEIPESENYPLVLTTAY